MRVISGSARGCKLVAPTGLDTRPTQDRVKESVFNIIRNYILDANVLDLFSGTGALAIEALSRGAVHAIMVDKGAESIKVINQNLEHTKLKENTEIYNCDVKSAIEKVSSLKLNFDIIFMDPPYNKGFVNGTLEVLDELQILNNDGIIVVERHKDDIIKVDKLKNLEVTREQKYKDTMISFLGVRKI